MRAILNFLVQAYERVLAVGVLLLVVICMGWLVVRVNNLKTEIKMDVETVPKGADAVGMDERPLKEARDRLAKPPEWQEVEDNRLFIAPIMKQLNEGDPPIRVKKDTGLEMKTSEGFTIRWLHQHNLPTDQPIANGDPDSDGFTNREEFDAGTNPTDASSHPDVCRKLRVNALLQRPFPFIFKGIIESATRKFNVQRADGSVAHFVELGAMVPDKTFPNFKVSNFSEKIVEVASSTMKNRLVKVDRSELTLEKEGEKPVVLVKDRPAASGDLSARLYFILEDRYFDVSPGSEFKLQDSDYQVVSIKKLDDGTPSVIIRRKDSPAEIPVLVLDKTELKRNFLNPAEPAGTFPPVPNAPPP